MLLWSAAEEKINAAIHGVPTCPGLKINKMDGEESDEINNDDEILRDSSDDEDEEDADVDEEQFLQLNGWLLLDREPIHEEPGSKSLQQFYVV